MYLQLTYDTNFVEEDKLDGNPFQNSGGKLESLTMHLSAAPQEDGALQEKVFPNNPHSSPNRSIVNLLSSNLAQQ